MPCSWGRHVYLIQEVRTRDFKCNVVVNWEHLWDGEGINIFLYWRLRYLGVRDRILCFKSMCPSKFSGRELKSHWESIKTKQLIRKGMWGFKGFVKTNKQIRISTADKNLRPKSTSNSLGRNKNSHVIKNAWVFRAGELPDISWMVHTDSYANFIIIYDKILNMCEKR